MLQWPSHYLWLVAPGTRLVAIYLAWLNALFPHPTQPGRALTNEYCILVQRALGTLLFSFFSFILFKCAVHSWVISRALWACWKEPRESRKAESDVTGWHELQGKLESPRELYLFCIHPLELVKELVMLAIQKEATIKEKGIGLDVSENG